MEDTIVISNEDETHELHVSYSIEDGGISENNECMFNISVQKIEIKKKS